MLRRVFRRSRCLLFLAGCVYIMTSFWILGNLDDTSAGKTGMIPFLTRVYDPFGSRLRRRDAIFEIDINDVTNTLSNHNVNHRQRLSTNQCYLPADDNDTDIKMDEVWDKVSVGYPKLVVTVTGWVDTIRVTSWSAKPLRVIVVPHSHQDPGWLQTADGYYNSFTKRTLDLVVDRLKLNPSWTFIWSEIVFLSRWWKTATRDQRDTFKRLLDRGQVELVTGGWVMPDEATTHYSTLIDQLIEGHRWINTTFNVTVRTGWAIDPFGHSSTMPYILRRAGIRNMIIQRTHFAVKRQFAKDKNFEFYWKQNWGNHGNGIFCHMMPFLLYSIPHSCGPDRHVCCKFDFHKKNCFKGTQRIPTLTVTDTNVGTLAHELWEQLQKKSELYRSNVVLLPHGDDFRYDTAAEWNAQFSNMEKLMKYMNEHGDMNIKIEFGTLADYFNAVRQDKPEVPLEDRFPSLSGDFLTYSDRGDQYWSGFYTTRPYLKHLIRKLQYQLRIAESMFMFSRMKEPKLGPIHEKLETVRRGLAVHLHHDAITGTSRKNVIQDYVTKLRSTLKEARDVYRASLETILTSGCSQHYSQDDTIHIDLAKEQDSGAVDDYIHINPNPRTVLIVSNMLGQTRREVVHVRVNSSKVTVIERDQTPVLYQISPVWNIDGSRDKRTFILSFEVFIKPFTIKQYLVVRKHGVNQEFVSRIENYRGSERKEYTGDIFEETVSNNGVVQLSNRILTAVISSKDGLLKSVYHHSQRHSYKSDTYFVTYSTGRNSHPFRDKSGAYVFLPDGVAKELEEEADTIVVIRGPVFSQIRTLFPSISHVITIFNTSGALANGVHVENVVNINNAEWNNRELLMRVGTDIYDDEHTFCTDVNGFQLQRRKTRAKMTLQGNFHPVTTMAVTENLSARLTLLSTGSHAMASVVSGWLEAVLDRRLIQDDWRGLNENVTDNVPVKSTFFLVFEERIPNVQSNSGTSLCLPSALSDTLTELLNNPLTVSPLSSPSAPVSCAATIPLAKGLPCGYHILNFRMIHDATGTSEALVVIHRRGIDCGYPVVQHCNPKEVWSFRDVTSLTITDVKETSLTGTEVIKTLNPSDPILVEPMEIKTFKIAFR